MNKTRQAERYGRAKLHRVVLMMTDEDLGAVDRWAIPAGQPSRSAGLRELIRKGLETTTTETGEPA